MKGMQGIGTALRGVLVAGCVLWAANAAATQHASGGHAYWIEPAPAFVEPVAVPTLWPQDLTGADGESWRNWLSDDQIDLRSALHQFYRDMVIQPLSTETLAQAAQLRVDFDPSWERLSLHRLEVRRDGEWLDRLDPESITLARREQNFESSQYNGQVTALIVIKDVRIGDVVRLSYTLHGTHPVVGDYGLLGFSFGSGEATAVRQLRILAPQSPGLQVLATGEGAPVPYQETPAVGGGVELRAYQEHLAALHFADQVPDWHLQFPALFVAQRRSWADVARWAEALYPKVGLSPAMQLAVERIRSNHPTPEARLRAALTLTQDEVRYFGMEFGASTHQPADPGVVLERRYGDCKDKSRLLVELLHALDIEAVPALVDTDYQRLLDQMPPAAGAFDHVIVQARIGTRVYWLDPTQTLQRGSLDELGFPDFERALLVDSRTTGLTVIELPQQVRDVLEVDERAVSADGLAAELTVVSTWKGGLAEYMRRELASKSQRSISENYRQFYIRSYGAATTLEPLKVEDAADRNEVKVTERYRVENYFVRDGNAGYTDFYAQAVGQFVDLPSRIDRAAPLALRHPLEVRHHVDIHIPQDARPFKNSSDNEDLQIPDPAWQFRMRGRAEGHRMQIDFEYTSRAALVEAGAVQAHLDQRRKLRDELNRRIRFRWQDDPAADRESRLRTLLNQLRAEAGDAR